MGASLEEAIEDGLGEVPIMEELSEIRRGLVGGNENGPSLEIAVGDDAVEDVGGIGEVALVPQLVEDEDVGVDEGCEGVIEAAGCGGVGGEGADEFVLAR